MTDEIMYRLPAWWPVIFCWLIIVLIPLWVIVVRLTQIRDLLKERLTGD